MGMGIIKKELQTALSPLEQETFALLKNNQKVIVRDLHKKLKKKRKVALTSVAVTLDRLYKKGLVDRDTETCKGGVRFLYYLKKDKTTFEKMVVEQAVDKLIGKFGDSALAYFNERFSDKKEE